MQSEWLTPEQKRAVLESAMQLALEHSVSEITVTELANASGVSVADIVGHFESRDNIISAVLEREVEVIAGAVTVPELRFPTETLRDELQMIARMMLQEYRRRLPFIRRLIEEAFREPGFGALVYQKFLRHGRLQFTEFLARRQERGEIPADVDIEAAAAMFFSAITGILVVVELFGGNQVEALDDERLVREFSGLLLTGILKR
jgi:TetR/AcrR family transcriptional regulator, acrAB operon repressor